MIGTAGPVFRGFDLRGQLTENQRGHQDVARILRRRCAAAGVTGDFAGHSLRSGFITNAAKKQDPHRELQASHWAALELDRAWFTGLNPELDDRAPIRLLAEGGETDAKAVLQAARHFRAVG